MQIQSRIASLLLSADGHYYGEEHLAGMFDISQKYLRCILEPLVSSGELGKEARKGFISYNYRGENSGHPSS